MKEDWKDQIESYLMKKGNVRSAEMRTMLASWIQEWVTYLGHFDQIRGDFGETRINDDSQIWHYVKVKDPTGMFPFKAYLGFVVDNESGKLCFKIKSTLNSDIEGVLNHFPKGDDRLFIWTDFDMYCEPEIFEKDYVLGILNSRLIKFNDNFGLFGQ